MRKLLQENNVNKKQKLEDEYIEGDKNVKKKGEEGQRAFVDKLAISAGEASQMGDMRTLYNIIKKLAWDYCRRGEKPVNDKNGQVISDSNERKMRWAEHFSDVLNRPPPMEALDFAQFEAMDPLLTRMDPINIEEVRSATMRLKNNKAAGEDNISAELLKATLLDNLKQWLQLYNEIWTHEKIPKDWKNGTIVKISKKGDLTNCNNWRGITLFSVPGKVFCSIIVQRICTAIDIRLREE